MQTLYGELPDELQKEFEEISGNKLTSYGDWIFIADEIEYWHLNSPESQVPDRKWKKKKGFLPVRDFNFQFACYKCPKIVISASGEKIKAFNLVKAIKYAKEKLFISGQPVNLPEFLWEKSDPINFDKNKKPPKSYNQILQEEEENFNHY